MLVLHAHKRRYQGALPYAVLQLNVPFQIIRPGQRYHTYLTYVLVGVVRFHVLFYVGYALAAQLTALHTDLRVL